MPARLFVGNAARVPFAERGGTLRGLLDLATGRYPLFLFGGPVGRLLPVFHLHEVTPAALERQLQFLADNQYHTVTSDAVTRVVRGGADPGRWGVALCFDDARASLWTVAGPLLRRYGLQAITFAIPSRIADARDCRPTIEDGDSWPEHADRSDTPFVTWPELRALHASGVIDVQSHTYSHASIFCNAEPIGFVGPEYAARDVLDRPLVSREGEPAYLAPDALGAPLFLQRSRMSDAVRFLDAPEVRERCVELVRRHDGVRFFSRLNWRAELRELVPRPCGTFESDDERRRAILEDLDRARAVLADRLRTTSIRHLCFPWGVGGELAREAARRVGYETAFSERLFGFRAVRPGDDPYRLMRLNGTHITRLPRRRQSAGRH